MAVVTAPHDRIATTREFNSRGCFIVLMSFSIVLLWGGVFKSLGVLLPTLTDQFSAHTWLIGISLSLVAVISDLTGLFTKLLEDKFGSRRVLILSTATVGLGLGLVPLAASVLHIAIILAILVGPALGLATVLNKVILGRHFSKKYSLACGISHTGQAVAFLAFAPLMQLFLDTYGWRGATLLLAGVCMHPVVCAALVKENRSQYQAPPDRSEHTETTISNGILCRPTKSCLSSGIKAIDLHIVRELNFWTVFSCMGGLRFVNSAWILFYVPHLQAKGFSPQASAALCSSASVGYFFGCVLFAPFVDRGILRCSTGVIISSLTLTLSLVVDPWANDILSIAAITFIFGLSLSAMYALTDVLTKELLGRDRLTSAFGWIGFLCVSVQVLAGFLPGWIYDASGNYDLAFIVMGVTPTVAIIPLIIRKFCKKH